MLAAKVAQRLRKRTRERETKVEAQAAVYSAMVTRRLEMLLCVCEDPHHSARAVHQSQVEKLERVSVVHQVKVPSFSVLDII